MIARTVITMKESSLHILVQNNNSESIIIAHTVITIKA